jgi:hypothetical protein
LKKRICQLERVLVKKTPENEILTEAAKLAMKKTDLAHALAAPGRFAMKGMADAMGVARLPSCGTDEAENEVFRQSLLQQGRRCLVLP